jgi:hypothetical protein
MRGLDIYRQKGQRLSNNVEHTVCRRLAACSAQNQKHEQGRRVPPQSNLISLSHAKVGSCIRLSGVQGGEGQLGKEKGC